MKTIIKNKFLEYNFLIFPIWILPIYFLTKNLFSSPEVALLIFLILFGESHFASTFLFYFNKENKSYFSKKKNILLYLPLIIIISYFIIGLNFFNLAIVLGAIASGIHVTRQSIGISRLFSENRNTFYELLIYFSSFTFLALGFLKFASTKYFVFLNEYLNSISELINVINLQILSNEKLIIIFVILISILAISEKTNLKKKLVNLTGVLIYSPYVFLDNMYDAMIIGVGAHWSQYLLINYKVYFYKQKFNKEKKIQFSFIAIYSLIMSFIVYKFHLNEEIIKFLVLIPLSLHMFHFYIDAFIWRFSVKEIRENIGGKLFANY